MENQATTVATGADITPTLGEARTLADELVREVKALRDGSRPAMDLLSAVELLHEIVDALYARDANIPQLTIDALIARFGRDEVHQALGLCRSTKQSTAMERAIDLLTLHMDAMAALNNTPIFTSEGDQGVERLVEWHLKQADLLVAELRRMGHGDGSSISVRRRAALFRWHADFASDAEDLLMLLQAEEALDRRRRLSKDHRLRQPNDGWVDDFLAGVDADDAGREERRAAALQIVKRQKEMARVMADIGESE